MSSPTTLTTYLLSLHPSAFHAATQTPFLQRAGQGTLPRNALQKWLAQDRLYAQAYVRFASLLLANVPLPAAVEPEGVNER
jgi:thiaminase